MSGETMDKKDSNGPLPPAYQPPIQQTQLQNPTNVTIVNGAPPPAPMYGGLIMVQQRAAYLGRISARTTCPNCSADIATRTQNHFNSSGWICCAILCFFGCIPCCLIPCCMDSYRDVSHACPNYADGALNK
eukprot:maker-scaffold531_size145796-snap-gene-0.23 protein:Tk12607 transcript:maker-scaffold531_size145796-snap-gene-0.23-mRNA-1 annotation:"lipopolysaccharide-induced tumor necrosis factor-alpha factor homolog"